MWTVIKYDKKKIHSLFLEIKNKFGKESQIYCPKIQLERFKNNKLIRKEFNLLGDYLFCFDKSFSSQSLIKRLNYIKGVKYYLNGFIESQTEIVKFIEHLKSKENSAGVINQSICETKVGDLYKFISGPFTEKIFKIVEIQKNRIQILMGDFKTTIKKSEYSLTPL